jgi:hypothetical protein
MDEKIIKSVWTKLADAPDKDQKLYRLDSFGNLLYYPSYGKKSELGWIITKKDGRKNIDKDNLLAVSINEKKAEKKKSR